MTIPCPSTHPMREGKHQTEMWLMRLLLTSLVHPQMDLLDKNMTPYLILLLSAKFSQIQILNRSPLESLNFVWLFTMVWNIVTRFQKHFWGTVPMVAFIWSRGKPHAQVVAALQSWANQKKVVLIGIWLRNFQWILLVEYSRISAVHILYN